MKHPEPLSSAYFENAAGSLREDPAGFIRARWGDKGQAYTTQDVQGFFANMMLGLQRRSWSRMLIDQTMMRPFTPEEQQWIAREWLPRAVTQGGYRHGAVIVSPEVMVRLATAYITTQSQDLPLTYRSFDTEAAAQAWLLSQPGNPAK